MEAIEQKYLKPCRGAIDKSEWTLVSSTYCTRDKLKLLARLENDRMHRVLDRLVTARLAEVVKELDIDVDVLDDSEPVG